MNSKLLNVLAELDTAPAGTLFTAGSDFMVKTPEGVWFRESDDSFHNSEDLADFHGHSGYSLAEVQSCMSKEKNDD